EWAYKDLLISKKTFATAPGGWFVQFRLNRKLARAKAIAAEIAEHGQQALERKDLELAAKTLPLAMNLYAAPDIEAANRRLQELVDEKAAGQQHIADEQQNKKNQLFKFRVEKKNKKLMADFKIAYEENNLVKAQHLIRQLEKHSSNTREIKELSKQFDADVVEHVQYLIEKGVAYYRRQQYEQAIGIWKEAQILDPINKQLHTHIDRAARVVEKLQSLRGKNGFQE
ncbi:MAG: hypothetical protein WCQ99_10695, partial [Pseudomonadota bacterium]